MAKKINWLDKFANDQFDVMQKTASLDKQAEHIIVDRSAYPNVKKGSQVDYQNTKYIVCDPQYMDEAGPGLLLKKVAEGDMETPVSTGEVDCINGTVQASTVEEEKNCGDCFDAPKEVKAARRNRFSLAELNLDNLVLPEDNEGEKVAEASEYSDVIPEPGGNKPAPSAPIEGPGKKNVTDAPYHPTFDPGERYSLEIDEEFQSAADRTADVIAQEDAQDRTTVKGHFTWNQNIILDNIVKDFQKEDAPVDEEVDELAAFDDSNSAAEEVVETPESTEDEVTVDDAVDAILDDADTTDDTEEVNEDEDIPADFDEEITDTDESTSDVDEAADDIIDDEEESEKKASSNEMKFNRLARLN